MTRHDECLYFKQEVHSSKEALRKANTPTSFSRPSLWSLRFCLRLLVSLIEVYLDEPFYVGSADWTLVALLTVSELLSAVVADRQVPAGVDHDVCLLVEAHDAFLTETVNVYSFHAALLRRLLALVIIVVAEYWLGLPGVLAYF